jgi:mannan endo-1,4-beta-mannosidase
MKARSLALLLIFIPLTCFAGVCADPNALPKTEAVLTYLRNLPTGSSDRIISGQYEEGSSLPINTIYSQTGKYPALMGRDYIIDRVSTANTKLIPWAQAGGLVTICSHFDNPASGGDAWDTTTVDMTKLITPGQALNTTFNNALNGVAAGLAELQSNGIIVIYKPFHEMNGGWFWWGGKSTTEYINAWKYIFNYLTNTRGLHNVLFAWSPNSDLIWSYYPGSAYVDIVGVDLYSRGTNMFAVQGYGNLDSYGKPFALMEYGPGNGGCRQESDCPSQDISYFITSLKQNMPKTVLWMNWCYWWSMAVNSGAATILNDPWVITRDEVPDFGTEPPNEPPSAPTNFHIIVGG